MIHRKCLLSVFVLPILGLAIGCQKGPGYHGTTSEENVGSRSSHELNDRSDQPVTVDVHNDSNAANAPAPTTPQPVGGGTSQEGATGNH